MSGYWIAALRRRPEAAFRHRLITTVNLPLFVMLSKKFLRFREGCCALAAWFLGHCLMGLKHCGQIDLNSGALAGRAGGAECSAMLAHDSLQLPEPRSCTASRRGRAKSGYLLGVRTSGGMPSPVSEIMRRTY